METDAMDKTATTLKTFEISIPEQYTTIMRKFIQSLGGKIHIRKEKKCGLDEALEDVKAGNITRYNDFESFKQKMLEL